MTIDAALSAHTSNYTKGRTKSIAYIVLHYTGNNGDTAKANCTYFSGANRSASAHYFCDESSIWQSVAEGDTAWHCGTSGTYRHAVCRNANSIGIEMCSWRDSGGTYYILPETVERAWQVTRYLMEKYDIPADRVIRHYDVTGKTCPEPWVRESAQWTAFLERLKEETMTQEQFNEMMKVYETAQAAASTPDNTPADWEKDGVEWAVQKGLLQGDSTGNLLLHSNLTRAQLCVLLKRYAG